MDEKIVEQIRDKAKELLDKGTVECVIGYETGSDGVSARPAFIYQSNNVDRLTWDDTCTHNLVKYLLNKKENSTAIVVKPCDAGTINVFLGEKQIQREKVFIIGVVCQGVLKTRWSRVSEESQPRCGICTQHTPVIYDFLAGEPLTDGSTGTDNYSDVADIEGKSVSERASFWDKQFERCIRCYACRQICPGCYCIECFAEMLDPEWVGIKIATPENNLWQTIRAFHQAGRCIECGECQRVCPVNIPLSLLNRKLKKEVAEYFDFQAGLNADTPSPLATFLKDENLGISE